MKTERPPEMWEVDTEDTRFVPLLGEMIAAGLSGGAMLIDLTLAVSNIVVSKPADDDEDPVGIPPAGRYVAITVKGETNYGPDARWTPQDDPEGHYTGRLSSLHNELTNANVKFAYIRRMGSEGSFTVFLKKL